MDEEDELWSIEWSDITIGKKIGEGQFGAVFMGEYEGTPVAIKKQLRDLDKDAMVYIQREMEAVKRLVHPHIVQFLGLAKHENAAWVVTEYCSRGDLKKMLYERTVPLTWSRRIHFALDVALALAFLHSKATMHRDIKSENVLIDEHWKAKLCDFGFATKVEKKLATLQDKKKMKSMTIAGTDDFMAPEVILGMPYSFPADMFSYGIMLTELILRDKPSERGPRNAFDFEPPEFQTRLKSDAPDCPEEFSALVLACAVYEPAKRPEAKLIVKGLRELYTVQTEREGATAAAAPVSPGASPSAPAPQPVTTTTMEVEHEERTTSAVSSPRRATVAESPPHSLERSADHPYKFMRPSMGSPVPSGVPFEKNIMRHYTTFCCALGNRWYRDEDLAQFRHRWLAVQDVPAGDLQQTMELQLHGSKKKVKYHCVLHGDALYYFKSSKKPEVNLGRILLDKSALIALEPEGKKNHVLRVVGWCGEEHRMFGKSVQLQLWFDAMQKRQQTSSLDLNAVYDENDTRPTGRTALTTGREVLVFPIVLLGGQQQASGSEVMVDQELMLCISQWGVQLCNPFLEEVVFGFSFAHAQKWSIQRNDMCEIVILQEAPPAAPGKAPKKPSKSITLEFKCDVPENVYAALEALSRGTRVKDVVLNPRVTHAHHGGVGKEAPMTSSNKFNTH